MRLLECLSSGAGRGRGQMVGTLGAGNSAGLSKHGYSTLNSIADSSMSYSQVSCHWSKPGLNTRS